MDVITIDGSEKFVRTAVAWIVAEILKVQESGGKATIGLCGGKTPEPVYTLLSTELGIDWSRVTFFLLDERYVPPSHPDSNQRMVRATLLTHEAKASRTVFPDTTLPLAVALETYDRAVAALPQIDLVIIGMGDDGHITSLFPPLGPETYGPQKVIHTTTDRFAVHDRISVTLPTLLYARKRLFLITGEKKSALLSTMQRSNKDVSLYPAQYLFDERTTWMVGSG